MILLAAIMTVLLQIVLRGRTRCPEPGLRSFVRGVGPANSSSSLQGAPISTFPAPPLLYPSLIGNKRSPTIPIFNLISVHSSNGDMNSSRLFPAAHWEKSAQGRSRKPPRKKPTGRSLSCRGCWSVSDEGERVSGVRTATARKHWRLVAVRA